MVWYLNHDHMSTYAFQLPTLGMIRGNHLPLSNIVGG
jgi:hypothetical protein